MKAIVHLADLHYRHGWVEEQGVVLDGFFKDLGEQIARMHSNDVYLVFSGDIVQSGQEASVYNEFIDLFETKLNELGIPRKNRICVPGNHDISRKIIASTLVNHEAVVSKKLDETPFNNYIDNPSNVLTSKFNHYREFERKFAQYGSSITGAGHRLDNGIGVYCLNTALCSCGGLAPDGVTDGPAHHDKERLAIDTRSLHSWNQSNQGIVKILVMHHPLEWLIPWAKREIEIMLRKDFALCLSGHAHDQSIFHSRHKGSSLIQCAAPPLFTEKKEELGYSFICVSPESGVTEITYRQWTKYQSFVSGVNFSNTDDGKVIIVKDSTSAIDRMLTKRLDDALISYSSQPKVWVAPILGKCPDYDDVPPEN